MKPFICICVVLFVTADAGILDDTTRRVRNSLRLPTLSRFRRPSSNNHGGLLSAASVPTPLLSAPNSFSSSYDTFLSGAQASTASILSLPPLKLTDESFSSDLFSGMSPSLNGPSIPTDAEGLAQQFNLPQHEQGMFLKAAGHDDRWEKYKQQVTSYKNNEVATGFDGQQMPLNPEELLNRAAEDMRLEQARAGLKSSREEGASSQHVYAQQTDNFYPNEQPDQAQYQQVGQIEENEHAKSDNEEPSKTNRQLENDSQNPGEQYQAEQTSDDHESTVVNTRPRISWVPTAFDEDDTIKKIRQRGRPVYAQFKAEPTDNTSPKWLSKHVSSHDKGRVIKPTGHIESPYSVGPRGEVHTYVEAAKASYGTEKHPSKISIGKHETIAQIPISTHYSTGEDNTKHRGAVYPADYKSGKSQTQHSFPESVAVHRQADIVYGKSEGHDSLALPPANTKYGRPDVIKIIEPPKSLGVEYTRPENKPRRVSKKSKQTHSAEYGAHESQQSWKQPKVEYNDENVLRQVVDEQPIFTPKKSPSFSDVSTDLIEQPLPEYREASPRQAKRRSEKRYPKYSEETVHDEIERLEPQPRVSRRRSKSKAHVHHSEEQVSESYTPRMRIRFNKNPADEESSLSRERKWNRQGTSLETPDSVETEAEESEEAPGIRIPLVGLRNLGRRSRGGGGVNFKINLG